MITKKTMLNKLIFISVISVLLMNFSSQKSKNFTINQLIGKEKISLFGDKYKLQKEVYIALNKMIKSAGKQGVKIHVVSAYRNFDHQNKLWKRKYNNLISKGFSSKNAVLKVMEYTAIPGTSRHHWGTDIDISNGSPKLSHYNKSNYTKWLNENAHKYGFYRSYTKNQLRAGYKYESWHFSYRKIAKPMLTQFINKNCLQSLKKRNIAGHQYFTDDFIKKHVLQNITDINDYLY